MKRWFIMTAVLMAMAANAYASDVLGDILALPGNAVKAMTSGSGFQSTAGKSDMTAQNTGITNDQGWSVAFDPEN